MKHACHKTCSGWQDGFEHGRADASSHMRVDGDDVLILSDGLYFIEVEKDGESDMEWLYAGETVPLHTLRSIRSVEAE